MGNVCAQVQGGLKPRAVVKIIVGVMRSGEDRTVNREWCPRVELHGGQAASWGVSQTGLVHSEVLEVIKIQDSGASRSNGGDVVGDHG